MNRKRILYCIAITSLIIFSSVAYIFHRIVDRKRNVLGTQYITRLPKEKYLTNISRFYRNYYEPAPDKIETSHPVWLPYTATYTYNHDGLNERYDYPLEKPENAFRIIVLGDSFAFGAFVNTKDNFSEVLEDRLNEQPCAPGRKYEVINLGVGGYDIAYTVERYRLHGQKYNPDLVIWYINQHNLLLSREAIQERIKEIDAGMTTKQKAEAAKNGIYDQDYTEAVADFTAKFGREALGLQGAYFSQFSSLYNGPLVVVLHKMDADVQSVVDRFVASRPKTWMMSGMPSFPDMGLSFPDGHPNQRGHYYIASNLYDYLTSGHLLQCP